MQGIVPASWCAATMRHMSNTDAPDPDDMPPNRLSNAGLAKALRRHVLGGGGGALFAWDVNEAARRLEALDHLTSAARLVVEADDFTSDNDCHHGPMADALTALEEVLGSTR